MPLYLLIGSRYKFCFLKKMSLVWTKNIYFISKCFFKDRFIFVIQQFFVKKGPVPEKTSCSPPLLLVYSTIKVRMTFCSLDPAEEGERSRGGNSGIFPPLLVKWFPLLLLLFKQVLLRLANFVQKTILLCSRENVCHICSYFLKNKLQN